MIKTKFIYKFFVFLISGVCPQTEHFGFINSVGSKSEPQESHWSPLAPSKPHLGQVPVTYLSAKKRLQLGQ